MQDIKHLIDQLTHKYCDDRKGYGLMDVKSALSELAKTLEDKHTEAIVQARLLERNRAKTIAYDFMKDHRLQYEIKDRAGNDLAFIEDKIAEECRYIGNAISGSNGLSAALNITMEDRVRQDVRADQLIQMTGLDKQTVFKAIYELKKGTLEEQLHWLKINEKNNR